MNPPMRIRAILLLSFGLSLAACAKPLDKQAMLAGCEAAVLAATPALADASVEYRAVVGREAIVRFQPHDGAGERVSAKCKVDTDGTLSRVKVGAARVSGELFEAAQEAFAEAARRH